MISVMNNDCDLERSQASVSGAEEARVSNDGIDGRDERVGDFNLNKAIRVSPGHDWCAQKNDVKDKGRVLLAPGPEGDDARVSGTTHCLNGNSEHLVRFENFARDDDDDDDDNSDFEIEFRVQDRAPRYIQNEVLTPEVGVSGTNDQIGETKNLNSTHGLDVVLDDRNRSNSETMSMLMNDIGGDFRLKRQSDLEALVRSNVSDSDLHDGVRAGNMKVLGSQFEMGDMVWSKVKSHPWWPGHIYNEALVSSSVRRTRRDGHVLVAFFGDSSYGWFHPTQLIPYEPHYAEKSQQINSRNFVKAVGDSVDEASRRCALALSCCCRNPYNFRSVSVPSYLAVDVVDYDPGAIYSISQIHKARESFHPAEALSFIKQLAVAPRNSENKSLDFVKHKATALAYRISKFEEFDETYAQAFGQQPVRPSQMSPELIAKLPSRAPLSGPLVIAEALGVRKSSAKVTKSKESSRKERYLFKRRDEAGEMGTTQISQVHVSSSSSAYKDGTSDSAASSYVFLKRDQAVPINDEMAHSPARDQMSNSAHAIKDAPTAGLDVTVGMDASGKKVSLSATSDSLKSESIAMVTAKVSELHSQVPDGHIISSDLMKKKKKKAAKRLASESATEKSDLPVEKKKKMRKIDSKRSTELPSGTAGAGAYVVKPAAKPMQISVSSGGNSEVSHSKKDIEVRNSVPQQMESVPLDEAELTQVLADLCGLAVNPFHGADRNRPVIVRQFFLKFRSLVFLKSSSASLPGESDSGEGRTTQSIPLADYAEESTKTVPPSKSSKLLARQDDPKKRGRKRAPSERQDEIAAIRAKKITEVKSFGAEKKAVLKNLEMQHADGKVKVHIAQQTPSKPIKAEQQRTKRLDRPPRIEEPTYLVMKFQSDSSLPSLVELKARFARFGPMDTSLSRVFYKTNTCRVAFMYKQDANVAHRYAVGNRSVFSNVKFMLRPVATPETQQPTSTNPEGMQTEPPSKRDSRSMGLINVVPLSSTLKSCLKKPLGADDTCPGKATRVRFQMGEDKGGGASSSDRGGGVRLEAQVQQMESRNALQSSSEVCPSSSSFVAMNVVSNNQRFISSHSLQVLPSQSIRTPLNHASNRHVQQSSGRNNFDYNLGATTRIPGATSGPLGPTPPPLYSSVNIDISQQMMSLLARCHDVVTNVKSVLGYVPYHPL